MSWDDDEDRGRADEEDEWPEVVPLTDEEQAAQDEEAKDQLAALTRRALIIAVVAILLTQVLARLGLWVTEPFAYGIAVGVIVSTINLRVLGNALWSLLSGQKVFPTILLGASLGMLFGVGAWIAFTRSTWMLGFGLGIALPVPAGIWFGLSLRDD